MIISSKENIIPFEVYPVQGIVNRLNEPRGPRDVAKDIAVVHNKVAEQGGRIVAQHEVDSSGIKKTLANFTYLVAEIPACPTEPS